MLTMSFDKSTLSQKSAYKWYKLFIEGREDVNDEARPGRSKTSTTNENVEAVEKIIIENHQITIREVVKDVAISVGSCHEIFSDVLGMKHEVAKFVPKLLNCDQKNHCMSITYELLNDVDDDPDLLRRVITGDKI